MGTASREPRVSSSTTGLTKIHRRIARELLNRNNCRLGCRSSRAGSELPQVAEVGLTIIYLVHRQGVRGFYDVES